ncbi:MAG: hypothetical protein HUN04_05915 [Desulfobacter sp.]|nr:MAG: hypothetical protein HUN04_05915 [Desulfobacter sp.]
MESRAQSYWIHAVHIGLILVLLLPVLTDAKQLPLSSAMKSLLGQANSMYLSRFGTNVDKLVNEAPMTFASILGVTIQRQRNYAYDNPVYKDNYLKLKGECFALLELVAKQKNFQNPKDGSHMTANDLNGEFSEGISGIPNNFFYEKFGFDPAIANLPMILDQVGPVHQSGSWEPEGELPVRVNKPNRIVIGGKEAGAAESSVNYTPSKTRVFPEDFLLGTWADPKNRNNQITFQRQGGRYVASLIRQFTDKGKPYSMKTVYTVLSSQINSGIAGKIRVWNVHRKYICTPKANVWNCTNGSEKTYRISLWPPMNGKPYYSISGDFIEIDDWIKI